MLDISVSPKPFYMFDQSLFFKDYHLYLDNEYLQIMLIYNGLKCIELSCLKRWLPKVALNTVTMHPRNIYIEKREEGKNLLP